MKLALVSLFAVLFASVSDVESFALGKASYAKPGYAKPGYAKPNFALGTNYRKPGYAKPGYAKPGYAEPGYEKPGYAKPNFALGTNYRKPGYAKPGYANPNFALGGPPQAEPHAQTALYNKKGDEEDTADLPESRPEDRELPPRNEAGSGQPTSERKEDVKTNVEKPKKPASEEKGEKKKKKKKKPFDWVKFVGKIMDVQSQKKYQYSQQPKTTGQPPAQ